MQLMLNNPSFVLTIPGTVGSSNSRRFPPIARAQFGRPANRSCSRQHLSRHRVAPIPRYSLGTHTPFLARPPRC